MNFLRRNQIKVVTETFIFILTGLLAIFTLLTLKNLENSIVTRANGLESGFKNEEVESEVSEEIKKFESELNEIDSDLSKELKDEMVSLCDTEFLAKYNFEDSPNVQDNLSKNIFPEGSQLEFKCV